jgi:hypothetical protein
MRTPDAGELLAGINRWTAIESKSDDPEGIAAMMAEAERDFRAAGPRAMGRRRAGGAGSVPSGYGSSGRNH